MAKLKITSEGKLGHTPEDVMVWADFYENIGLKIERGEELDQIEVDSLVILLKRTAKTMREKPKKFLPKKQQGRPNQHKKDFYAKQLQIYAHLGIAKNISEARRKLAIELLEKEKLDYSQMTYDDYLLNKIQTIEAQTRKFNFDFFAKNDELNKKQTPN